MSKRKTVSRNTREYNAVKPEKSEYAADMMRLFDKDTPAAADGAPAETAVTGTPVAMDELAAMAEAHAAAEAAAAVRAKAGASAEEAADADRADEASEEAGEAAEAGEDDAAEAFDDAESEDKPDTDEEPEAPGTGRRRRKGLWRALKLKRRPNIIVVILVVIIFMLLASLKNLITLEIEHQRLLKEREELIKRRDRLQLELKHVNSEEYIKEQARRQLRLVNPDEILFIFEDEEE